MGKENPNKENPNEECHGFKVGEYALYEPVMHSDGPELAIMKNGVVPVRVIGFTPIRVRVEIQLDNQRISKKAVNPLSLKKRLTGELVPESTSSGVKVIETPMALTYNLKALEEIEPADKLKKKTLPTQGVVGRTVRVVQYEVFYRPRTGETFRVRKFLN